MNFDWLWCFSTNQFRVGTYVGHSMRYYISDFAVSAIILLTTVVSINLSQIVILRLITMDIVYVIVFQFAVIKHRALPRLVIIFCFFLDDVSQGTKLGISALSIMIAIESTRLLLSRLNMVSVSKVTCSVIFAIFYFIYSSCQTLLLYVYDSTHFNIIYIVAQMLLSLCVYGILFSFASSLYSELYPYYKSIRTWKTYQWL